MTPQELAALPVGTRIKYSLAPVVEPLPDETEWGYDYGTIERSGTQVLVAWDAIDEFADVSQSFIDTSSLFWAKFIEDISLGG